MLNDDDFWGKDFQARTPLKRDLLADLLDKLTAAGVNTVALDVDLRSPLPEEPDFEFADYEREDKKLIQAMERMCQESRHLVLASSITDGEDEYVEMPSIYTNELHKEEKGAMRCVSKGYIQLPFDLRRIPGVVEVTGDGETHLDSMALAVTAIADRETYDGLVAQEGNGFRFSNFLTLDDFGKPDGQHFIFSGHDILSTDSLQLRPHLADKIVFIGANWNSRAHGTGPSVDMHPSPGGALPGVMLQANYVEAILDRTGTLAPISDTFAETIEVALVLLLALISALNIRPIWKWVSLAIACSFSVLLTYTLIQNLGLFLDFFVPLLIIIFHTLIEHLLDMRHELHEARQLTANLR